MKILQIVQTLDPRGGGVASAVRALSCGLARRGHKIDIVTLDEPNAFPNEDVDLTIHALGHGLTSYRYSSVFAKWLAAHGNKFDRVIINGIWQHQSFATWRQFHRSTTPYYVFPHGMLDPWFKRTFPLKHAKKWLYWPWAEYRVLRDAAAVIFTSEEERLQARESFWLYRCNERVSPLGIEPPAGSLGARDKFLGRYPELRNRPTLLFLGRLHPKKGCDMLLDSFPRASDFCLVMAGPDQIGWERELRRRIDVDLARRVVFTGMLEGEMKQGAFAAADAFILPSHQENFGVAVVEALAAGVLVLISNRVNIWREIEMDRAGFVEDDTLTGTTRLIERWRDASLPQREQMRENARNSFARRFHIERAVDSLLSILAEAR